jgi:multiple sugar transport system permease protein
MHPVAQPNGKTTQSERAMSVQKLAGRLKLPNSSRMSEEQFSYLMIIPLIVVLGAIVAYPVASSLWMSLNDVNYITHSQRFVGLAQYLKALRDPVVVHAIQVTLQYTVETTVLTVLLALGAALLLNENFRGKAFLSALVILPWSVSTYATSIVWRYLYSQEVGLFNGALYAIGAIKDYLPIVNQYTGVTMIAIAHSWQLAPLGAWFFLASLQTIPQDLYRAARVDHLRSPQRFWYVTFPYLKHALVVILVLVTVEAARVFDTIYFLTGGGPGIATQTLTFLVYRETFQNLNLSYGSAISYLLMIIIFVLTTLYFMVLFARKKT